MTNKREVRSWLNPLFFCTGLILLSFSFTLFIPSTHLFSQNKRAERSLQNKINQVDFEIAEAPLSFAKTAKEVLPIVVSISSTMVVKTLDLWQSKVDDEELREFFGEKYLNFPFPKESRQRGSGSGIIVSPAGHILTNLHVVENAESIIVELYDHRSFKAQLVGADPLTELAVIKVDETDLPVAKFGNSDSVKIGDWVLAVGNPLELSSTVTAGIVSAIGRDVDIIDDNFGVENFIQTDATINPGSSGGALVNLNGEVIGVNTAIATQSGYSQGLGFAIPINLAKQIMSDLIEHGYVIRSYLGISMQDVDEKIARAMGLQYPQGVFIDYVEKDSPARCAGLREKDILVKIDDQKVNQGNIVQSIIAQKKPGEEVLLSIIRKNRVFKAKVLLGERRSPETKKTATLPKKKYKNMGLKVGSVSRRLAEELNLESGEGVIVTEVIPYSPAYDANIRVNDVILEINDERITSLYAFVNIISKLEPGKVYILKMKRHGNIFHRFIEAN